MKRFHEDWAVIATIDPKDANAANESTDEIDMSKWLEVACIVQLGVINASATYDFKVRESQTAGGTYQDLSGKAITQLTGAGADGAKQVIVGVEASELSAGYRYIKGVAANSAHSQLAAVLVLGRARYQPASDDDLA